MKKLAPKLFLCFFVTLIISALQANTINENTALWYVIRTTSNTQYHLEQLTDLKPLNSKHTQNHKYQGRLAAISITPLPLSIRIKTLNLPITIQGIYLNINNIKLPVNNIQCRNNSCKGDIILDGKAQQITELLKQTPQIKLTVNDRNQHSFVATFAMNNFEQALEEYQKTIATLSSKKISPPSKPSPTQNPLIPATNQLSLQKNIGPWVVTCFKTHYVIPDKNITQLKKTELCGIEQKTLKLIQQKEIYAQLNLTPFGPTITTMNTQAKSNSAYLTLANEKPIALNFYCTQAPRKVCAFMLKDKKLNIMPLLIKHSGQSNLTLQFHDKEIKQPVNLVFSLFQFKKAYATINQTVPEMQKQVNDIIEKIKSQNPAEHITKEYIDPWVVICASHAHIKICQLLQKKQNIINTQPSSATLSIIPFDVSFTVRGMTLKENEGELTLGDKSFPLRALPRPINNPTSYYFSLKNFSDNKFLPALLAENQTLTLKFTNADSSPVSVTFSLQNYSEVEKYLEETQRILEQAINQPQPTQQKQSE